MKRRRRLFLLGAGSALLLLRQLPAAAQPSHKVSAQQLRQVLAQRFPLRYPVPGLFELQIAAPQLRFLPQQNRVASAVDMDIAGPALRHAHSGSIDLDFALRYEPSDSSIRAHQIRIHAVRLPTLSRDAAALIDAYARASAERALLEVVLHTLHPRELALANTMGFDPGTITVIEDGLEIGFVARQR